LAEHLKAEEIETGFHYQPNHLLTLFKTDYPLPVAERLAGELFTLPLHAELTDEEQDRVIAAVLGFFRTR
jgi:dTDP-4-amino-4,6-dideoxygalactose transaminase